MVFWLTSAEAQNNIVFQQKFVKVTQGLGVTDSVSFDDVWPGSGTYQCFGVVGASAGPHAGAQSVISNVKTYVVTDGDPLSATFRFTWPTTYTDDSLIQAGEVRDGLIECRDVTAPEPDPDIAPNPFTNFDIDPVGNA